MAPERAAPPRKPKDRVLEYILEREYAASGRRIDQMMQRRLVHQGSPQLKAKSFAMTLKLNQGAGTTSAKFQASPEEMEQGILYLREHNEVVQAFARNAKQREKAAEKARRKQAKAEKDGFVAHKTAQRAKGKSRKATADPTAKAATPDPSRTEAPAETKAAPRAADESSADGAGRGSPGGGTRGIRRRFEATAERVATGRDRAEQAWGLGVEAFKRELGGLWRGQGLVKDLTFFGRLVVRVPAFVPVALVVWMVLGLASMVWAAHPDPEAHVLAWYVPHAFVGGMAAVANAFFLFINAIGAGISEVFRVVIVGGIEVVGQIISVLFGGLYGAVNALLLHTDVGDAIEPPKLNTTALDTGPFFALAYLQPGTLVDDVPAQRLLVTWDCESWYMEGTQDVDPLCTDWVRVGPGLVKEGASLYSIPNRDQLSLKDLPEAAGDGVTVVLETIEDGAVWVWNGIKGAIL